MTYLLDANTCIKFLNGQSATVRQRFEAAASSDLVLCSVVKAELLYGAMKSARPQANLAKLHGFFERFVSFPFSMMPRPKSVEKSELNWQARGG